MGDKLTGIAKGSSGFVPQNAPDVKIFNAQTEIRELTEKMEKAYARLGRQVYESDGSETFPETKTELELLTVNRQKAERRLQEARDEKTARERAEKKETEETILICPACGAANPKGTKFCQECGIRQPVTATKRFCTDCGTEIAEGNRFCGACGVKVSE